MLPALLKIDAYIDSYSKLRLARGENMAGAGKRKQKGAASFIVKERKAMIEDFLARDYNDVVTTAM